MGRCARVLICALVAVEILWLCLALADKGGQRGLFNDGGRDLFGDFWMPRICLRDGYVPPEDFKNSGWQDGVYQVTAYDRCYPPLAMLPLRPFPATREGALSWAAVSAMLFLLSMLIPARRCLPLLAALPLSMPFLFALERANTVWISAACVGLFLSWYESEVRWKRVVAALALSVAAVFKISPALLGMLYLNTRRGVAIREILLCVGVSVTLFFVPFLFVPDGFGGLPAMLSNAMANGAVYARATDFGLLPVWRAVRVMLAQDCSAPWPGMLAVMRLSQVIGLVCVLMGCVRRDRLLATGGMLMAAGNMFYYGMLYLLPLAAFWAAGDVPYGGRGRRLEGILWFVVLCPLQLIVSGHQANGVLGATALIALLVLRLASARPRQMAAHGGSER